MALAKPSQITVPFSSNGVKNTIPETATGSNLASMQEGFPVITMTDVDQGGMPPQGQDMNGILFDVTKAIQYQQAGGLFPYDATFAQAIDGYPLGALLTSADGSCLYQNTVSGNVSDPDNGGQGWSQILSSASIAGKQDKLTPVQMDAVNSGITSARVAIYDSYAAGKQDTLTFDNTPTNGSSNPVTSDGIYAALGTKQDTITVDAVPTSGSANPVQSGGVYDALSEKVDINNAGNAEVIATGSTESRTLADRFADIVNVKDFGAVGNNSTDDTAAIQAAIDTGKDVYFPCNNNENYKVTQTLVVNTSGQSFYSDPQSNSGLILHLESNDRTTPLFEVNKGLVRFTNLHMRAHLQGTGICIHANPDDVVVGSENSFTNNGDVTVHECDISNFYIGLQVEARSPKVYGTVFGLLTNAIEVFWNDQSEIEAGETETNKLLYGNEYGFRGTVINDNVFHVVSGNCIYFTSGNPNGSIISGNRFDVGTGRFINCEEKLQGAAITGNAVMYSGLSFVETTDLERCSIVGNTFRGSTVQSSGALDRYPQRHIYVKGNSKHNTITGNSFECSEYESIRLNNSYYDTVTGNTFIDCVKSATASQLQGCIFFRLGVEGSIAVGNSANLSNEYGYLVQFSNGSQIKNTTVSENSISNGNTVTGSYVDGGGNHINDVLTTSNFNSYALPLSGGNVTGTVVMSLANGLRRNIDTGLLTITGGNSFSVNDKAGSRLFLCGASLSSQPGEFQLNALSATGSKFLIGKPDGTLTWDGQAIQTSSDERLKTPISSVPDDVLDAWGAVNWGQFQYLEAVKEKGESARLHLGLIAQHVKSVFEAQGLDACEYGILCHEENDASYDEEGNEIIPARELWTVRYTEAQGMEAAYQRRRADRIESRLKAIEERMA